MQKNQKVTGNKVLKGRMFITRQNKHIVFPIEVDFMSPPLEGVQGEDRSNHQKKYYLK